MHRRLRLPSAAFGLALFAMAGPAPAEPFRFAGEKAIVLHTRDGEAIPIGTVTFTPADGGSTFAVRIDPDRTTTYFLSMRNFRCIEGEDVFCHVPYPYPIGGPVATRSLDWLEHALLFLTKSPKEFGARFENGIYFRLEVEGERLVGTPQGIDLDQIASPPDDPSVPPYSQVDRYDEPEGDNWIARLTIE